VKSKSDKPRVAKTFEEAIDLDPDFEWVESGVDGYFRRREGTSEIEPWGWKVVSHFETGTHVSFETELEGATVEIIVRADRGKPVPSEIRIKPKQPKRARVLMEDGSQVETDLKPEERPSLDPLIFARLHLAFINRQIERDMRGPFIRYLLNARLGGGLIDPFLALPRPGRSGRLDLDIAIWADRYVLACLKTSGRPMPLLEKERPGFTAGTLRDILHQARSRGLLTEAPRGKAGGDLTKKCLELLTKYGHPITSQGA